MSRSKHYIIAAILAMSSGPALVSAESSVSDPAFFNRNGVRDIFNTALYDEAAPQIELLPRVHKKEETEPSEQKKDGGNPQNQPEQNVASKLVAPAESNRDERDKSVSVRDEILSKYGDPAVDTPLKAVETAPAPFKGMLEALERGEDQLAFEYARNYVRYVNNFKQKTDRITGLSGLAMEREGLLEKGGWQSDPRWEADRKLLEEDLKRSMAGMAQRIELNPELKELLQRASKSEGLGEAFGFAPSTSGGLEVEGGEPPKQLDPELEKSERERARLELRGGLPVARSGVVEVYFLFRPRDSMAQTMASSVEAFHRMQKSSMKPARVAGIALDAAHAGEVRGFQNLTKVTFPLGTANKLSQTLKIDVLPAVVFLAPDSGKAFVETTMQSPFYMDEVVRMMRGQ